MLASCHTSQDLAYISDAQRDSAQAILTTYNTTIHPGDQLYIYVYSQNPEAAMLFNQETHAYTVELSQAANRDTNRRITQIAETSKQKNAYQVPGYLVDQDGTITFPILGKMVVAGLTQDSLSNRIQQMLIRGGYLLDPVVTVTPMNFRVSVVGEVRRPQEIHVTGDRLTILEAIAMCGDITMDGQRENITVMRDVNGVSTPINVDITKKSLFDSQVYYLQTNDIVYVEPNKLKKRKATRNEMWPRYVAFWVSVASAVANIGRANVAILRGF
jgi:polysaccharide export outer membrane protein